MILQNKFLKHKRASIILLMFLSFSMLSYGQETTVFYTESLAMKFKDENGKWKDWTDWHQTDVIIEYHTKNNTITINTTPKETYTIIGGPEELIKNEQTLLIMNCTDNTDITCDVIFSYDEAYNLKIYIEYGNLVAVYKIRDQKI